jgi:hypothetical protein
MPLSFLNLDEFIKHLKPVTSSQLFTRTNDFHPEGLFSELIFGIVGSLDRKKVFSYINLNCYVVHPSAYKILIQLDRKIEKFLSTESFFKVDKSGLLTIDEENGVTGISEFIKIFPKIVFRGDTPDREKFINLIKKSYKDKTLFIDKCPVIPPDQRQIFLDEAGRWIKDPINDHYETILRRTSIMKTIGIKGVSYDLFNWGIQTSIIDHDTFIRTKIGKKFGLIRSQLLGKRVEFSGRAVITSGPQFKTNEIGLPLKLALSLFEPFILHVLLYSGRIDKKVLEEEVLKFTKLDLSTNSIAIVFRSIKAGDVVPSVLYDLIFNATEIAMTGRVVLAKRDPVLHAEGVRAFYPVLTKENTIQLSTLSTGGFNADFDGDQMAVFHPITNESQDEAQKRMLLARSSNSSTALTFEISKEMATGLYILSKDKKGFKSPIHITNDDLEKATDPYIPVVYKNKTTTMGKAIINSCFPKDFRFVDELITKNIANNLIFEIINKYGDDGGRETANRLKNYGFKFATLMSPSLPLDDITIPDEIYKLKKNLDKATPEEAIELINKMSKIMIQHLKDSGMYDLVESGAIKNKWELPIQIFIAKGVMSDPTGKILAPIKSSLADGLTPTEYFSASGGARKGIIDRVLNTSTTGYSARKLAYLLNSVEADTHLKDCKTDLTLDLKLDSDLIYRLNGRFIIKGSKIIEFEPSKYKDGDVIHLRTPIFCKSLKICHTCYGRLLEIHKSPYVGIIAAQNIGERATQLIMRSFHNTAIKIMKRDILQDISNNDSIVKIEDIKSRLSQNENSIYSLSPSSLLINLDSYTIGDDLLINEEENTIEVDSLISTIDFGNITFDIILDYPVILKYIEINKTNEFIKLTFNKDDEIFEVPKQVQDIKEIVLYIERLLGGKERFKDVNHLFLKFYKMYNKEISSMDLVHMEILISQVLRDKNNPTYPARVGSDPEHPSMANIKQDVFSSSFIQGMAFENIGKAINTGLITTTELEPSILEKLLSGTLVEKKEKD